MLWAPLEWTSPNRSIPRPRMSSRRRPRKVKTNIEVTRGGTKIEQDEEVEQEEEGGLMQGVESKMETPTHLLLFLLFFFYFFKEPTQGDETQETKSELIEPKRGIHELDGTQPPWDGGECGVPKESQPEPGWDMLPGQVWKRRSRKGLESESDQKYGSMTPHRPKSS